MLLIGISELHPRNSKNVRNLHWLYDSLYCSDVDEKYREVDVFALESVLKLN